VYAEPDELSFSLDISVEAESLTAAQSENRALANTAIEYLKESGVESKNIQTQFLNVSVQYRDRQAKIPRYYANQTIEVKLEDISTFESINAGLLERGITGLRGPRFASSKMRMHKQNARIEAVKSAKKQAELLAGALDQTVGVAITIDDRTQQGYQPVLVQRSMMAADAEMGGGPGIATGQLEIKHEVTVTFELKTP